MIRQFAAPHTSDTSYKALEKPSDTFYTGRVPSSEPLSCTHPLLKSAFQPLRLQLALSSIQDVAGEFLMLWSMKWQQKFSVNEGINFSAKI